MDGCWLLVVQAVERSTRQSLLLPQQFTSTTVIILIYCAECLVIHFNISTVMGPVINRALWPEDTRNQCSPVLFTSHICMQVKNSTIITTIYSAVTMRTPSKGRLDYRQSLVNIDRFQHVNRLHSITLAVWFQQPVLRHRAIVCVALICRIT